MDFSEKDERIHKRLREIRKNQGFTQQTVADFLGVDRTTYTYYELGAICPNVGTFRKLSELYNLSAAFLICETDIPEIKHKEDLADVAEEYSFVKSLTRKEIELIAFFRALDEKKQNQLIKRLNPNAKRYAAKK